MRLKREHIVRERVLRSYQREFPYWVDWHVHNTTAAHSIYEESGERTFLDPRRLPVLWIYDEDADDSIRGAIGRPEQKRLSLAVSARTFRAHVGVVPDPEQRLDDMLTWDGFRWDVQHIEATSFSDLWTDPMAAVHHGDDLTLAISAVRRIPDYDMPNDSFPS